MRHGALCSGYGGLSLAVEALLGCDTVWHAEVEPAAVTIHELHWPNVPNLGDLTTVEWESVPPVDVLSAGFPCQPVSHAGKRKGTDDERWLWDDIADAVGRMGARPRYLFLENVGGLLSANGGDAFRSVVHDLAALGFSAEWLCLRAADVGAPHGRLRWFCVAEYADTCGWDSDQRERAGAGVVRGDDAGRTGQGAAENADRATGDQRRVAAHGQAQGGRSRADADRRGGAPSSYAGGQRHGGGQDRRSLGRVDGEDAVPARQRQRARQVAGDRGATPPADTAQQLRPFEQISDDGAGALDSAVARTGSGARTGDSAERVRGLVGSSGVAWGNYGPAIRRWEAISGRPAPAPTDERGRLSAHFVEWMMGLPAGWVTDAPISRSAQLKALGNGVVPLQAYTAYSHLLSRLSALEAAA